VTFDDEHRTKDSSALEAAQTLYGDGAYRLYDVPSSSPADDAFPLHTLYRVVELAQHPVELHVMAEEDATGTFYDYTGEFNDLLANEGVVIDSSSEAVTYGKAYADLANVELQTRREVVNASDSDRLGYDIQNPSATSITGGWKVTLSTWAEQNGVLANWTITFALEKVTDADWTVADLGVGPDDPSYEAANLKTDDIVENAYNDEEHTVSASRETDSGYEDLLLPSDVRSLSWSTVTSRTTFDGVEWTAYEPDGDAVAQPLAADYAAAGNWTYTWLVEGNSAPCSESKNNQLSWGFESEDGDCTLEIRFVPSNGLLCGACVVQGNETVLYVFEDLHDHLNQSVNYYRDGNPYGRATTASTVVGHLYLTKLVAEDPGQLPDVNPIPKPGDFVFDNGAYNGTLAPEHFALRSRYTTMFEAFQENATDVKNVTHVAPSPNGSHEVIVGFNGSRTRELPTELLPRDWGVQPVLNRTRETNRLQQENNNTETVSDPSLPNAGLGPGTLLRTHSGGCSANFLWENSTGGVYLGTAGHCIVGPGTVKTNFTTSIFACVENCTYDYSKYRYPGCQGVDGIYIWYPNGSREEVEKCVYLNGTGVFLEDVRYARNDAEVQCTATRCFEVVNFDTYEMDMALIKVPPEHEDLLRAHLPVWGGPESGEPVSCSEIDAQIGGERPDDRVQADVPLLVQYYGHGIVWGDTFATQGRASFFPDCDDRGQPADLVDYNGPVAGGDSGMAVTYGEVDDRGVLASRRPLAIHTWGWASPVTAYGGGLSAEYVHDELEDRIGESLSIVPEGGLSG
jgi:hypothetical protein